MLSKNKIKQIQSLNRKKNREESGLFLVEGNKMVEEAIHSDFKVETLVCTSGFLRNHPEIHSSIPELIETDNESIQKASLLQHSQDSLAIVHIPVLPDDLPNMEDELILALDFIQDPGNLGTILRIADWFGIRNVICSENTVDIFNPKVVQASMGAIFRVKTRHIPLNGFLKHAIEKRVPVYGTFLEGRNIYTERLTRNGILVMGNEGNGISDEVTALVNQKICIPSFSSGMGSESLNVAIAAAICCSEFRRR